MEIRSQTVSLTIKQGSGPTCSRSSRRAEQLGSPTPPNPVCQWGRRGTGLGRAHAGLLHQPQHCQESPCPPGGRGSLSLESISRTPTFPHLLRHLLAPSAPPRCSEPTNLPGLQPLQAQPGKVSFRLRESVGFFFLMLSNAFHFACFVFPLGPFDVRVHRRVCKPSRVRAALLIHTHGIPVSEPQLLTASTALIPQHVPDPSPWARTSSSGCCHHRVTCIYVPSFCWNEQL